ncbi:histamine H2 receptor-like [Porites lutea]|uniref:histamine H2 receptor-like n=1 Tax=Porites lutea TaxID=51062 RepID=UPI003CC6A5F2
MTILNNDSHTGNGSFLPSAIPTDTIPAIVLTLFILFINAFVVLLIGSSSSLRSTSNIILASLALSDFLMGLVGIPLVVACSSTFASPVCLSANLFSTFNSVSSVLHILVMTFDRYIFIMWALRYREIFNRRRVFAILSAAWLISLTLQLVRLSWTAGKLRVETAKEDVKLRMKEKELIFFTFNAAVFFFVPLIAMIILDTRMLLLLRNQCQRIARENLPAESIKHETKMQKRQMKAVITCVLLLSLYVAFWLPSFIVEFLQHYATDDKYGQSHGVMILIAYLRFCPALFNPIAYTLRKPDLKRAARSVVYKTFPNWKTQFVENRTEQIPLASRSDV